MKFSLLFFALFTFSFGLNAQDIKFELYTGDKTDAQDLKTSDEQTGAKIEQKGDPMVWDYGELEQGDPGVRFFKFKNTGAAPLIISNAKGSCGCTVPSYPKEPIMPGGVSFIKVKYDTNRKGGFTKYVTLTTNSTSESTTRLKVTGNVKAAIPPTPAKEKNLFN
jgi:hypothetical protein